jgi:EpsI family protein
VLSGTGASGSPACRSARIRLVLALIALALLLHLAEKALDLNGPSPLSIPIFVAGAVWFFLGTAFLRALAFPIAYLIFMIPIPGGFTEVVSFPLRLLATNGSKIAAGWFGVDVQGSGMNIHFGQPYGYEQIMLQVADPCSGLHSLMAIKALHAITAYLTRLKLGWKWVLFMCAIPIALMANLTRITGIILIGAYWSKDVALGLFHDWSSPVLFAIAFAILISIGRFLEWATLPNPSRNRLIALVTGRKPAAATPEEKTEPALVPVAAPPVAAPVAPPQSRGRLWLSFGTVLSLMTLTLLGSIAFARQPDLNLPVADVNRIPKQVGAWRMQRQHDLTEIMGQIKADSYVDREYVNPATGQMVELLVVYRRYGRREFAHRPELCFPAAGYSVQKNSAIPLFWAGRDIPAVSITANRANGQSNLSYFFASGKRTESDFIKQQVWMAFERLMPNKNGWTFIRLQSPTVTTSQDAIAAQQDFMRTMAPVLERVITTDGQPTSVAAATGARSVPGS